MTVEENLWMGGYLKDSPDQAKEAAEQIFTKYTRLSERRKNRPKFWPAGEEAAVNLTGVGDAARGATRR